MVKLTAVMTNHHGIIHTILQASGFPSVIISSHKGRHPRIPLRSTRHDRLFDSTMHTIIKARQFWDYRITPQSRCNQSRRLVVHELGRTHTLPNAPTARFRRQTSPKISPPPAMTYLTVRISLWTSQNRNSIERCKHERISSMSSVDHQETTNRIWIIGIQFAELYRHLDAQVPPFSSSHRNDSKWFPYFEV